MLLQSTQQPLSAEEHDHLILLHIFFQGSFNQFLKKVELNAL